jgi:hypothetical protein
MAMLARLLQCPTSCDEAVDHRVVIMVLHVEVLLDEARRHVVVDRVGYHQHVVEILWTKEVLVQQ